MSAQALDSERLAARAAGRQDARAIIDLARDALRAAAPLLGEQHREAFFDELREFAEREGPTSEEPRVVARAREVCPLTAFEEMDFLEEVMEFGRDIGKRMSDMRLTDMSYWVGRREGDIVSRMERYLAIPRVAERLREELERDS